MWVCVFGVDGIRLNIIIYACITVIEGLQDLHQGKRSGIKIKQYFPNI